MSDLAATNCGCGCEDNCGGGMRSFGGDCSCMIWILLLLCCCGGGNTFGGDGCGDCSCLIIILLLFCCGGCGGGRGFC